MYAVRVHKPPRGIFGKNPPSHWGLSDVPKSVIMKETPMKSGIQNLRQIVPKAHRNSVGLQGNLGRWSKRAASNLPVKALAAISSEAPYNNNETGETNAK